MVKDWELTRRAPRGLAEADLEQYIAVALISESLVLESISFRCTADTTLRFILHSLALLACTLYTSRNPQILCPVCNPSAVTSIVFTASV